jgi:MFS transporter, NNP family, nitrate/nitrite transporter
MRESPAEKERLMNEQSNTWISEWNPEDNEFWESQGKTIARRNLIWSIVAEHLGFSIWLIWSIVATKLPQAGFHFTTDQLFQLVALPGLIGSLMRFPYTFAVTTFGGRNWTIFSAAVLFIPTIALAYFVTQPDTPFSGRVRRSKTNLPSSGASTPGSCRTSISGRSALSSVTRLRFRC